VFVVEAGKLRKRPVTPGLRSDLTVEILEGVEETTQVVASPDSTLVEGTDVRPVDEGFRL
jgi:multidrug efflux pump subunit AcrA (membrane-fusion protein)